MPLHVYTLVLAVAQLYNSVATLQASIYSGRVMSQIAPIKTSMQPKSRRRPLTVPVMP